MAALAGRASGTSADDFPLSKGTYWIYAGTVQWFDFSSNKSVSTTVKWKTEIERVFRRGDIVAAVVRGFPSDLDWSDGHPAPTGAIIARSGSDQIYLMDSDETQEALKIFHDPRRSLDDFLNPDDLILELPLAKGKKFGCHGETMQREDSDYCWAVDSVRETSLDEVKGITRERRTVYTLRFVTNPDDTAIDFVPGIGFIAYEYHHHGSVADTELKLIEFHLGKNP